MGQNIIKKILCVHLRKGECAPGREIGLRIDQTLTQDASVNMGCLNAADI